jgi:hypothetical protein
MRLAKARLNFEIPPPHRVDLDVPPFVLALDVAEVGAKVFQ